MRRISLSKVVPGMTVAKKINDGMGRTLVNKGVLLTERYIKSLKEMHISTIYIEDGIAPDIVIEDVIPEELRNEAIEHVRNILTNAQTNHLGKVILNSNKITPTVETIIEELLNQKNLMMDMVDIRTLDNYIFSHLVNVTVMSIITGISLRYTRAELFYLAMGTIYHDIGMSSIPSSILNKKEPLNRDELEQIKKHTFYGHEYIKDEMDNPLVAKIAYEHHERHRGQGYPQGLKGDEIFEFSKIVSIADTYDAMTSERVYKKACYPHEAFDILAGSGNNYFDYNIVKAFLENIAAYPTGSLVELSNGAKGIVVSTAPGFGSYPKVRVLKGPEGEKVSQYEINLAQHTNVVIKNIIDEI